MSSANDKKPFELQKKVYVITYKEWFFTLFVFIVILVTLFPKDLLKQQIMAEKSNYDLSMLYLKNLIAHHPKDESLILALATQSEKSGKIDMAVRLSELLLKSKNEKIRNQALLLTYKLKKRIYFYLKDEKKKKHYKKELAKLFTTIYERKLYNPKEVHKWYKEALFVENKKAEYHFLTQILKQEPNNIELLQNAYYLALALNKEKSALRFLHALQQYDTHHAKKWILQEYYTYMQFHKYDQAEALLQKYAKKDLKISMILGDFYLYRKKYEKASKVYLELYKKTQNKKFFKKALNALLAGKKTNQAVKILKQYEDLFIYDSELSSFILKVYLQSGKLDDAARFGDKLLQRKYRK